MSELEAIKYLLQSGAAGVLIIAGAGVLKFLREERTDRADERREWFGQMEQITGQLKELTRQVTEALRLAREEAGHTCPFTGATRAAILEYERRLRDRDESW